jgi:flagellar hook-basal body complex protein FliE
MSAIGSIGAISGILGGQAPALGGVAGLGGAAGLGMDGVGAAGAAAPAAAPGGGAIGDASGAAGGSFVNSLSDALGSLNTQLVGADASMADFAAGGSADLHSVMLQMQEASIGLKTGIAVRDRLLEAYQEIMRLSI